MATPKRSEKQRSKHSYLPYLATPWGKLNCLYLVMEGSFVVWAIVEIGIARRFETTHALMIIVGSVVSYVSLLSFRMNREAKP